MKAIEWATLAVGLVGAATTAYWAWGVSERSATSTYLKIRDSVTLGRDAVVRDDMLEVVRLPSAAGLDGYALRDTPVNRKWLLERRISRPVTGGSLVLYQDFQGPGEGALTSRITKGRRAMTIPVAPEGAVGQMVMPGNRVDIVVYLPERVVGALDRAAARTAQSPAPTPAPPPAPQAERGRSGVAVTVLQAVRVLATGSTLDVVPYQSAGSSNFRNATIEVTPEQVELLTVALRESQGGAILTLRAEDDTETRPTASGTGLEAMKF